MPISVDAAIPAPPASLTEKTPEGAVTFPAEGTYLIVAVPGAFTPPCSDHVPTYIGYYDQLLEKGVKDIYIVAVNDIFVVNAWKKHLFAEYTLADNTNYDHIHFLADRSADFTKALGLDFDASGLLGNTRSQRAVITVKDGKVSAIKVEVNPPDLTYTMADEVLKTL